MKVVAVYAAMPGFEHGLNNIMKIMYNTFNELGVETEEINIAAYDIHYFDGIKSSAVENIINKIKLADGVVFAAAASVSAVCAIMQTFIEHIGFGGVYENAFEKKKCFVISASKDGSERVAADYLMNVIALLGAADCGRMAAGSAMDGDLKGIVEKYAEDFYRVLRQDRGFFYTGKKSLSISFKDSETELLEDEVKELLGRKAAPKKIKAEELLEQIDFQSFNQRQEQDINEISKLLKNQYGAGKLHTDSKGDFSADVVPHIKNCRQRTQSLHHYFQPQLAGGLEAVIQINVKGGEKFEGYLVISDGSCSYREGVHESPDVTVFADSAVWLDILNGKYTTQKAFMIGQLKVRGNFVLLTKFDQLFNLHQ